MNKLQAIIEHDSNRTFLVADGFDEAVIGFEEASGRLIYSVTLCLEILITRDNMELEEAIEYFDFNVRGAYYGPLTPIWCDDGFET